MFEMIKHVFYIALTGTIVIFLTGVISGNSRSGYVTFTDAVNEVFAKGSNYGKKIYNLRNQLSKMANLSLEASANPS